MRRGDVVLVADRAGDFSGKPRPGLVIQSDAYNDIHASVTICPISSTVIDAAFFRIPLRPTPVNGLKKSSEVEVDKVQAVRRSRIGERIGSVVNADMVAVDGALRRWLSL